MIELIAVATITALAVVSPGTDFAMVTRNSLLHGRSAGMLASAGIALGVQLHVLYTLLGVGLLLQTSPGWFTAVKLAGAFYLVYVGYKTFSGGATKAGTVTTTRAMPSMSAWDALRTGFFTNALNPKTTLFVVSLYTQVVRPDAPMPLLIGYGLFISLMHALWFGAVAVFFSDERLRHKMLQREVLLNRLIGSVLVALGLFLALASAAR